MAETMVYRLFVEASDQLKKLTNEHGVWEYSVVDIDDGNIPDGWQSRPVKEEPVEASVPVPVSPKKQKKAPAENGDSD